MSVPDPNVQDGISYWNTQPASLDGVLGGYGSGSLPRVDSLGSRQFLLHLIPALSTVPSSLRPLAPPPAHRTRALDVGAGIGRVSADVLLYLVSDVVLLEPVDAFVRAAYTRAWDVRDGARSVTVLQGTLQAFDPSHPLAGSVRVLGRVGHAGAGEGEWDSGFDVVWCQWCLGHLSDGDLVAFLQRSRAALRSGGESLIVVKENLCRDALNGGPRTVFDEQDSSLTRSDMAWKKVFTDAGLTLIKEKVQEGLPEGLYVVKMYALR